TLSAAADLRAFLDNLVRDKEQRPGNDILSRQIVKLREEGREDHRAVVELALVLLIAGHETTANMISLITFAMLAHPDVLDTIRRDPSKTPDAVEELLRMFSIIEAPICRIATEDLELCGVRINAGEGVIALVTAGNYDPKVFPEPSRIRIDRDMRR